jgi:predicted  nucleic acid-binding Zn-ribbon protein
VESERVEDAEWLAGWLEDRIDLDRYAAKIRGQDPDAVERYLRQSAAALRSEAKWRERVGDVGAENDALRAENATLRERAEQLEQRIYEMVAQQDDETGRLRVAFGITPDGRNLEDQLLDAGATLRERYDEAVASLTRSRLESESLRERVRLEAAVLDQRMLQVRELEAERDDLRERVRGLVERWREHAGELARSGQISVLADCANAVEAILSPSEAGEGREHG